MLVETTFKQGSFYTGLYHIIPGNHILKRIDSAISLSFINELLADRYCKNFGRPAKEPEMMLRIQILKCLYNLSDEQLIQDLTVNLAYKWFVGLNPEDPLPETSLLTKFRTQRLKNISLDAIIAEIVRQCVAKGIIKSSNGIAIDTTHIEANTIKKVPERIMKHLSVNELGKGLEVEKAQVIRAIKGLREGQLIKQDSRSVRGGLQWDADEAAYYTAAEMRGIIDKIIQDDENV